MGGIQQIEERPRFNIRGVIRLGYKDEGDKGRMHNTEHFILRDAPDVEKVYGPDPKEIDIVFPGNDIDVVAFSAFQHWMSKRGPDGKAVPFLMCQGNGPSLNGTPGAATWFDRDYAPPEEEWLAPRDVNTGFLQRACRGEGARGACEPCKQSNEKKCGPRIILKVIIPLVSIYEVYLITSGSWNTISNVRNQLRVLSQLGVPFTSRVFTIYKEVKGARPWDISKQQGFKVPVHYMAMRENKEFVTTHEGTIREALKSISTGGLSSFLSAGTMASLPASELFELPPPEEPMLTKEEVARQTGDSLVGDPEIEDAFATLEHFRGTKFTAKAKLTAIRKKEGEPDIKAAVIAELDLQIKAEMDKIEKVKATAPEVTTEVASEVPPLEPGIM